MSIIGAYLLPHPPLLLPAIGKGDEERVRSTRASIDAVMQEIASFNIDTVIIISPHAEMYMDYIHISPRVRASGDFGKFGHEEISVTIDYDEELVEEIVRLADAEAISAGTFAERDSRLDHGTMLPLIFLSEHLREQNDTIKCVRIGVAGLPAREHYRLGRKIQEAANNLNRQAVVIASGDLSHKLAKEGPYGLAPEGSVFDAMCQEYLREGDLLSLLKIDIAFAERAAQCGLPAIWLMIGTLDRLSFTPRLYSYEAPFGVGYAVASFLVQGKSERDILLELVAYEEETMQKIRSSEHELVKIARQSVEHYILRREYLPISEVSSEYLAMRYGAFVSLKLDGRLRGCIGTFLPRQSSLVEEISYNAVSAATSDNRFEEVRADELANIIYSVDVVNPPEVVHDVKKLNPKIYGVIVASTKGDRLGLLLPDLEGINTVEEQLRIAREKGRIGEKESVTIYSFTVTRYK